MTTHTLFRWGGVQGVGGVHWLGPMDSHSSELKIYIYISSICPLRQCCCWPWHLLNMLAMSITFQYTSPAPSLVLGRSHCSQTQPSFMPEVVGLFSPIAAFSPPRFSFTSGRAVKMDLSSLGFICLLGWD